MRNEALLTDENLLAMPERSPSVEDSTLAAQLRADAARLLLRAEADKHQVARAVHDQLGQALTSLSLELSVWKTELDAGQSQSESAIREKIALLTDRLGGALSFTRAVSARLRPRVLEEFGLSAALEWHLEKVGKRTGVACSFSRDPAARKLDLDPFLAGQIYQLAEEVIEWRTQVGGPSLRVLLLARDSALTLVFEDGGATRGLTPEIAARVRLLGGEVRLNKETQSIRIALPVEVLK